MAPSRRMTSPFSIGLSTMCSASAAYSAGLAEPGGVRHHGAERVARLLWQLAEQRGVEQARGDRDDPDEQAREVAGDRQGHADDPALGRGVGRLADLAVERGRRGRVDDHAALAVNRVGRGHRGGGEPDHVEGADQVHRDDPGELLERVGAVLADGAPGPADAGAVDRDAQRCRVRRGRYRRGHVGLARHVTGDERAADALRLRGTVGTGQVEQDHVSAGRGQPLRGSESEPGGTAGDQGGAALNPHEKMPP